MEEVKGLVSVGIPTYNRPDGLKRTLEQICAQTYTNLEIIVSDNCSPDPRVKEVVDSFVKKDSRITYFRQKENIGAHRNFQFVLSIARGEFFMWAADDDEWDSSFVKLCIENIHDAGLVMQSEFFANYRGLNKIIPRGSITLSTEKSTLKNVMHFLDNYQLYLFYGIYRRNVIIFYLKAPNTDGLDAYSILRVLLNNGVNTFPGNAFRNGIDGIEYEQKPMNGVRFRYSKMYFLVCKQILLSKNVTPIQKLIILSKFSIRRLYSFSKFEKQNRPLASQLVLFFLKCIYFIKNKISL